MSSYYDEQFIPWKIADGQCVVADEAEWDRLDELNEYHSDEYARWNRWADATGAHEHPDYNPPNPPIVKVPTDIFEDVEGRAVNRDEEILSVTTSKHHENVWTTFPYMNSRCLAVNDILTRVFQTIDDTPHVDYLLMTQRPELVREKLTPWTWHACETGDCPHEKTAHCLSLIHISEPTRPY